jgi:hypothetical protein
MVSSYIRLLLLILHLNICICELTTLDWLSEAVLPGKVPIHGENFVGKSVEKNTTLSTEHLNHWEIDNVMLKARLKYLREGRKMQQKDNLVWPLGTVDYDRAVGPNNVDFFLKQTIFETHFCHFVLFLSWSTFSLLCRSLPKFILFFLLLFIILLHVFPHH